MTELTQDWSSFQRIFHPEKRSRLPGTPEFCTAVIQGEKTLRLLPTSDQFPFQGRTTEIKAQVPPSVKIREVTVRDLEDALEQAISAPAIFDQLEIIRESLKKTGTALPEPAPHFLIRALTQSWWAKVLPSSYGVLLALERTQGSPIYYLLVIRKGHVSAFFSPDLGGLSEERAADSLEVVKYLSEKYALRIQGITTHWDDWMEWSESESPWKRVSTALRQDRVQFIPFRFRMATLVGARGHLGI